MGLQDRDVDEQDEIHRKVPFDLIRGKEHSISKSYAFGQASNFKFGPAVMASAFVL